EKFSSYARYFDYDSEGAAIGSEQFKGHSLFKVFSAEPLDVSTLAELFSADSCVVTTRKWFAYPIFSPPEDVSVPFRVKQNHSVFNSSVLEFSVAAMEVSAISGRNVALLVYRDFCKDIDYEKSS
ncbi:PCYOX1L, partial [Symbiodinium microadriaticum]